MDYRRIILGAGLALLVAAVPVAACLMTAHEAPAAERAHEGCEDSSNAPSGDLCAVTGSVVTTSAATKPTPVAPVALPFPSEQPALDRGGSGSTPPVPRARSAPIHLLHATFLI